MFERVYVWQVPVRIFHWLHFASILVLAATGAYIGHPFAGYAFNAKVRVNIFDWVRAIHFVAAYVFTVGFAVRVYWWFAGNRYAAWRDWIPTTRDRLRSFSLQIQYYLFLRKDRPGYLGHNPVAGLTYAVLAVMIVLQAITGYAMYSEPFSSGFWHATFRRLINVFGDQNLRTVHHLLMWLFGVFFIVHLYMAILADLEERNGILSSMVNGAKFRRKNEGR